MTRMIDADALNEKLCKTTIFIKDGEVFQRMINDEPTIEPTGDLISRQAAIAEFRDGRDVYDIMESIEQLPSAPDSRQHGEWVDRSEGGRILHPWWESRECDQCGDFGSLAWNFCPNCGADMRGEEE